MSTFDETLMGSTLRLEPLSEAHAPGLTAAAAADPSLYAWSAVPQGEAAVAAYIGAAVASRQADRAVPFAIVRKGDGAILGSTRFFELERWSWPHSHPRCGRTGADVCEIGYTWLTAAAIRTRTNTEAKLLMLTQAFEGWGLVRVCLHTDVRNARSRAAIERIGGKLDGILRAHRLAVDAIPRESARYSILASEWPEVKRRLTERLEASG